MGAGFFLITFLIITHIRFHQYAYDDAYIHFRVVRNLIDTGKPYYNLIDVLKVSSSSGWIIFLAIFYGALSIFKAENSFPMIISVINALISFGGLYIYTRISMIILKNSISTPMIFLFQASFLALILPSSIGLMETPLALFIAGLGVYSLLHQKYRGFTLLGIASYIRLEILILLVLIIFLFIIYKRYNIHRMIGYCILGVIPFVCFDLFYFQTIIPHAIIAKSKAFPITTIYMITKMCLSLPGNTAISMFTFISMILLTSYAALRDKKNIKNLWSIMFLFWGLGTIFLYFIGRVLLFEWYTPLYTIPILVACFLYSHLIAYPRNIIIKIPLITLFLLSIVFISSIVNAEFYNPNSFILFGGGARVKTYLEVGEILNHEYKNATLLTSEIGGLGYSFKGKIIDAVGLASRDALIYQPMKDSRGAISPEFVKMTMPDIIVSYDSFAQALLNDNIVHQYNTIEIPAYLPEDAIHSEDKAIWGNEYLRIYIHKKFPVSEKIIALGK